MSMNWEIRPDGEEAPEYLHSHSSVRDGASRHAVILAAGSLVEALPNWWALDCLCFGVQQKEKPREVSST
ncbi:hypothetical protein DsansV1_C25g0185851 [Dioscorea sansibarensis]